MLTARAITRSEVTKAAIACTPIKTLARVDSGMVSVGLKAVEFVTDDVQVIDQDGHPIRCGARADSKSG
jgi:hypothetical protein